MRAKLKFLKPRAQNVTRPLAPIWSWSYTTLANPTLYYYHYFFIPFLFSPFNKGVTGKIFWGGKVIFPDFFPGVKCFFPVENFHFGRPKTNFIHISPSPFQFSFFFTYITKLALWLYNHISYVVLRYKIRLYRPNIYWFTLWAYIFRFGLCWP